MHFRPHFTSVVGAKLIWFCPRTPPRMGPVRAAPVIISHCLQLNYTRPGLPKLNPRLLESWKNEVKEKGHINCPNNVSTFSLLWASLVLLCRRQGEFGGQKPTSARFWCVSAQPLALGSGCTMCFRLWSCLWGAPSTSSARRLHNLC